MKAQKDTLQTLDKLYPIVTGAVFVFFFFALVFTITAAGQPAFLWRPWPMESLAPRYSELQQERGIRWARYWYSDYAGESSEYQFSSLNIYMLQFLLYYILLTGTLIFILALEWIGTRLHAMPNRPLCMSFDLPQLGHGAFVVFVTVALTFPPGPFSYILFCFGVTKCMYPEIIYTLWAAFSADPPVAELKLVPETYWRRPQMHYQADMSTRGEIKSLAAAVAAAQLRKRWKDQDKGVRAQEYENATAATNAITKATHDHLYDLDLNQKFSAKFVVHFSSGCGLMLHHFSLVMIYCGSSLHLIHQSSVNPSSQFPVSRQQSQTQRQTDREEIDVVGGKRKERKEGRTTRNVSRQQTAPRRLPDCICVVRVRGQGWVGFRLLLTGVTNSCPCQCLLWRGVLRLRRVKCGLFWVSVGKPPHSPAGSAGHGRLPRLGRGRLEGCAFSRDCCSQ
jgi:hypothetical protein